MEKSFKRDIGSLDALFQFLQRYMDEKGISGETAYNINLAVEELFTNLVKYETNSDSDIMIELTSDKSRIVVSVTESTTQPFEFSSASPYDTTLPLEDRPVGKLGIHLIRSVIDSIESEYKDNKNTIRLVKKLGKTNA